MRTRLGILVVSLIFLYAAADAQMNLHARRSEAIKSGNFGHYPTKVRFAPIISFGSAGVNYTAPDSFNVRDTALIKKLTNPNYTWGDYKPGGQFGIGLMLDIPFSRNLTFRPRIAYNTKSSKNASEYTTIDTTNGKNAYININRNNSQHFSQLETMFMLDVQFGSDLQKTRVFMGVGFGFAYNLSMKNNFDLYYISSRYTDQEHPYELIDTSNSVKLKLGNDPSTDYFTRFDFLAQAEVGVDIGNISLAFRYNGSLGSLLTDPRIGDYKPYYFGLSLAYIFGERPDIFAH